MIPRADFGITGFIRTSFVDWPGRICAVVFLGGCNFRCPACHNQQLVVRTDSMQDYPLDDILGYLNTKKNWIDGITVTGGEPTIRKNLPELLNTLRGTGPRIKLDTNGSNPAMLAHLVNAKLVDAIAMDVKAPLTSHDYAKLAGVPVNVRLIKRSIQILKDSDQEIIFRTTVIPGHVEEPQLEAIRESLGDVPRYILQSFRNKETLDASFSKIEEFPLARVEDMKCEFEIPSSKAISQLAWAG
jgi:pyruvate formate lyase activating enzyme